ncbi:MAG: hypothetical protein HY903_19495 [Deltaproteobacteria bacterium]|nr:hypothetical protein [Deltaproteobacteria bacterium]
MAVRFRGGTLDYGSTGEWSGGEARGVMRGFIVGQGRVGIDRLADVRQMVPPTPTKPVPSTDLLYATTDQLVSGDAGKWKTFFPPTQAQTPDPAAAAELAKILDQVLAASGLAAAVGSTTLGQGQWGRLQGPHLALSMRPGVGVSAEEVYARLKAGWPRHGLPLPALTVSFEVFGPTGAPPPSTPQAPGPLAEQIIHETADGRVEISASLTAAQRRRLDQWAAQVGVKSTSATTSERLLAGLLRARPSTCTPEGRATLDAMRDLGLFSGLWPKALTMLQREFGDAALAKRRTFYNGHATFAMASLLPTLRAFGAEECSMWVSNKSGTQTARELLRLEGPDFFRSDSHEDHLAVNDCIYDLLVSKNTPLIVDKGRSVVDILRPEWKSTPFIGDGRVRFVVHNRDDGMGPLMREEGWGVDLANSLVKKLEARFIGEAHALIGAREARTKLGRRIGDTPTVIIGFGLLGEQVARALARLGMPRRQIVVEDTDPAARARAERLGFSTRLPARRPPKAVVYVATADTALNDANAGKYADDCVVIALTSAGKGVKFASPGESTAVYRTANAEVHDRRLRLPATPQNAAAVVHLTTDGQPANLVNPMHHDRFAVTSLAVAAAMLQAGVLTKPGIEPLRRAVDRGLVKLAWKNGLWEPRPLEARPGEDPADLRLDLESFRPSR